MKGIVKTMRGEALDMGALASRNASVVALGNAGMNARGDLVDRSGNVIKSREAIVHEYYNKNPKAVTQRVSLKDLGDEVLTPAEVMEQLEGKSDKAAPKKRKVIDED